MKKQMYLGVACGLLAALFIYPSEPLCWLVSIVLMCRCAWHLNRAERLSRAAAK